MKFYLKLKYFFLIIGLLASFTKLEAQEYEPSERDTTGQSAFIPHKGFHAGLFVGAFWANKYTAYLYDGYGFDQNGQRNTFNNSILYNQIVNVYGGANGGVDYIAKIINVNHSYWYFK